MKRRVKQEKSYYSHKKPSSQRTTKGRESLALSHGGSEAVRHRSCSQILFFLEFGEDGVPLFGIHAAAFVLIETVAGPRLVELDAQALHVVEFLGRLSFGPTVDFGESFDILPIDVHITIFLVGSESRFEPFSTSDVALVLF